MWLTLFDKLKGRNLVVSALAKSILQSWAHCIEILGRLEYASNHNKGSVTIRAEKLIPNCGPSIHKLFSFQYFFSKKLS